MKSTALSSNTPTFVQSPELEARLAAIKAKLAAQSAPVDQFSRGAQAAEVIRPAAAPAAPITRQEVGQNFRSLVKGLLERETKLIARVGSVLKSLGVAAFKMATLNDIRQGLDFAKLAIQGGHPGEVFGLIKEILSYVAAYPEEARRLLKQVDAANPKTWTQKTPWIDAATGPAAVAPVREGGAVKRTDVAVIGAGLSGGSIAHLFSKASRTERTPSLLVLEADEKSSRAHAASLRNAGIVCTAMEYVFGIDEAIGEKAILRIQDALGVSRAEADEAYRSLMEVMRDSRNRLRAMMGQDVARTGPSAEGGLDVAITEADLADFRAAVREAKAMGFDWEVVDAAFLEERFGLKGDDIKGALFHKDGGQVHSGRLIKALFDRALADSKKIEVQWGSKVEAARPDPSGQGWILDTAKGPVYAKQVIDAREGFAPFRWREARYSQIHLIDVPKDSAPMKLGETNLCHGLSYMRKVADGKYLVGSGDFPIHDTERTPAPMASVALYTAAMFHKVFGDVPFNVEQIWGGVFGLSKDGIPVTGALAKDYHVVGGAGGQGLSLMPALAADVVNDVLGHPEAIALSPHADFSPRRFFLLELRKRLQHALHQDGTPIEKLRIEVKSSPKERSERTADGSLVLRVDEATLDRMNPDVGTLLGEHGRAAAKARQAVEASWMAEAIAAVKAGLPEAKPNPSGRRRAAA
ncbi:MAG: FAD-dependent oxidoreductase [Myxococcota bacterium]